MSQTPPNHPSAFEPDTVQNAPFSLEENLAAAASAEADAFATLTNEASELKAKNAGQTQGNIKEAAEWRSWPVAERASARAAR